SRMRSSRPGYWTPSTSTSGATPAAQVRKNPAVPPACGKQTRRTRGWRPGCQQRTHRGASPATAALSGRLGGPGAEPAGRSLDRGQVVDGERAGNGEAHEVG